MPCIPFLVRSALRRRIAEAALDEDDWLAISGNQSVIQRRIIAVPRSQATVGGRPARAICGAC